jgi:S1-C subfamily serine protease
MARPDMAALTAWSDQLAALAEHTAASVVAVHVGRHESVSGTLWRPNVIVTAAHALRRSHDITLTLPDGSNVLASLAGADGSTAQPCCGSTAQLADRRATPPPLEPGTGSWRSRATPRRRDRRSGLIGRTGAWQTWRGGRIDRLLRLDGALGASFARAPIIAADGAAIGVGTPALARGFGIVVPTSTVNRVADKRSQGPDRARLFQHRRSRSAANRAGETTGTQRRPRPAVTSIAEDSPAAAAGLLIGDVLLEIDGHRVATSTICTPLSAATASAGRFPRRSRAGARREARHGRRTAADAL